VKNSHKQVAALIVGAFLIGGAPTATAVSNVSKVVDGDTINMINGEKVRLVQIDTPELASKACYGVEAKLELTKLLSLPGEVTLKADPMLNKIDKYGRSLRYVFIGDTNLNLRLVEIGAAAPYFYRKEKGLYAGVLLKAAQSAQKRKLGLWGMCPGTRLSPNHAIQTKAKTGANK